MSCFTLLIFITWFHTRRIKNVLSCVIARIRGYVYKVLGIILQSYFIDTATAQNGVSRMFECHEWIKLRMKRCVGELEKKWS